MRFDLMIAFAAMPAALCCAALPHPSETNATVEVAEPVSAETNAVVDVVVTNIVTDVVATNIIPVKVVYPDDTSDDFCVDDWAEDLAEKAEQGVHVKNDHALVVVRLDPVEGEHQSLTKLRAKFRAIEFLRYHYHDLPSEFSAPCRILSCDLDDEQCVVIVAFRLKDLK